MDYLEIACRAALLAGKVHLSYFNRLPKIRTKQSVSYDLLTAADIEAEKKIVSLIKRYYPEHNFLCEENRYKDNPNSPYRWIIDPLDGTNNFACGLPIFCVSIALLREKEVIVAAVYDPTRRELFFARKDKGAYLNNRRIKVNTVTSLRRALLITGFYYDRGQRMIETLQAIKRFHFAQVLGIRRLGAAALDICYVACGRAAGFWEFELSPWDFAAGSLLVKEAGGRITDNRNKPLQYQQRQFIVASNARLHKKMLDIINARD